jgi:mannose-6-phosphate isomerase-like protein (cupin superfamily)
MSAWERSELRLDDLANSIQRPWEPIEIETVNDSVLRMARLEGKFPWHQHGQDELFLCWRGAFNIEVDGRAPVHLEPGELYVVERGRRHRPVADAGPAVALLIERSDTLQYGDEVAS